MRFGLVAHRVHRQEAEGALARWVRECEEGIRKLGLGLHAVGGTYDVTITTSGQAVTGLDFGDYQSGVGPIGPETRVNVTTAAAQQTTTGDNINAVASDLHGSFVVVWQGQGQGDVGGVFGQRYDNAGNPLGSEFQLNTYTRSSQARPAVASDANGNFVVVWEGAGAGDAYGVFGQRYDSGGNPLGSVPTSETPWSAKPNATDAAMATTTATSTPGTRGSQRVSTRIRTRLTSPIATAALTAFP